MNTIRITKRSYLRSINQAIPMKENDIKEYDFDFEDEEQFIQLRSELEDYYKEERIVNACNPLPAGYMSLEEFDQLLQKKIKERYAEV